MNKLFSKVAALSVGLAMAIGVGVAVGSKGAKAVKAASGDTYSFATAAATSGTASDGMWSFASGGTGTAPAWNAGSSELRIYVNDYIEFTAESGVTLLSATFTIKSNQGGSGSGKAYPTGWTVDNGTISSYSGTATSATVTNINASSFKISVQGAKGNVGFKQVVMQYESAGPVETFTITYDSNGGSGTMESTVGPNPAVAPCTFTAPEGKVFERWNDSSDGKGTDYVAGDKPGANLDLYAIWGDAPLGGTINFGSATGSTKIDGLEVTGKDSSGLDWTITTVMNETSFTQNAAYSQVGSSSKPATSITFTATLESEMKVVAFSAKFGGFSGTAGDVALKVGSTTIGTGSLNATNDVLVESTDATQSGTELTVTLTNIAKGVKVYYVSYELEAGVDPSLKNMTIKQSGSPAEGSSYQWSSSADIYLFTAEDEDGAVSGVTWSVSNTSVATIKSNGRLTTVIPGSVTVYAEAEGYNKASASIEIIKGWIEELEVTGSMTKTSYTTAEQWSPAGLVATATFHSGWTEDVASKATWTYNPAAPADGVTSVVATATYDEMSASSSAQAVTVTVKHAGTQDDPFTVAEARAQIDGGTDLSGKYATGIVSEIVTVYSSEHLNVTFNISVDGTTSAPQLQAYREKSTYSSTVKVGDIVVVGGTLKKFNSTYEFDAGCAIVSLEEPTGQKYPVIDRVDYGSLDKEEVLEGSTLVATIIPETGYWYPTSVTVLMGGSPVDYTYENGAVTVENVNGNVSIEGTCTACNQIQSLYAKPNNAATGEFYGYYVGFMDGTGPVLMDGEYGIVLFGSSYDVSSWTEKETIVHVSTGTISIYNGLYEVKNFSAASVTEVPEGKVPSTPVVYATKGGETPEFASRLTTVTGTPTVTSGSFDSDAGTADIKMNFAVGQQTIQVFYKKAAQTADAEAFAAMKAAVEGSKEITINGFTSWYNGFQVQMNGYVPPVESYTAADFAEDLLSQTDAICVNFVDGESSYSEFKIALEAVWSDLASNDKYPSLPADQKTILAEAARNPEGSVVEQAMARYDFLTGKYGLSNFINGRTPVQLRPAVEFDTQDSNTMIIIIAITAVSAISLATLLVLKKKKHN